MGYAMAGDTESVATAVSGDGSVVVGLSENDEVGRAEAFRWTAVSGMVGLGLLPGGTYTEPHAVSADGSVIVGSGDIAYDDEDAFIWTENAGIQRLFEVLVANGATGLNGWTLEYAFDISSDGKWVVGYGINPNGSPEAFLADISSVPIPAAVWLFGTAVGLMWWTRRKPT
jgi:probable HAF family extracellular repeat protein